MTDILARFVLGITNRLRPNLFGVVVLLLLSPFILLLMAAGYEEEVELDEMDRRGG